MTPASFTEETFLNRLVNLEHSRSFAYPLKLDRAKHFFNLCGVGGDLPFDIILVAGSKGKGSTSAMIESLLRAHGLRTGFYSSPHLVTWRERIRVDADCIPPAESDRGLRYLQRVIGENHFTWGEPTYFEVMTALALLFFKKREVQIAVLEVGLGGEYDATNACQPSLSVITPIGWEHRDILGPTLQDIANAKCGIMRRGVPLVVAHQNLEVMQTIRRRVAEAGPELIPLGTAPVFVKSTFDEAIGPGQEFEWEMRPGHRKSLWMPLWGQHQLENAHMAVEAAGRYLESKGRQINPVAVQRGFAAIRWPGRIEVVSKEPLVVLDGAHNPDSGRALALSLGRHLGTRRAHVILGLLRDKDPAAFVQSIQGICDHLWLVPIQNPRSFTAEELYARVSEMIPCTVMPDYATALGAVMGAMKPDHFLLVTGSLYLVGEAKQRDFCLHG